MWVLSNKTSISKHLTVRPILMIVRVQKNSILARHYTYFTTAKILVFGHEIWDAVARVRDFSSWEVRHKPYRIWVARTVERLKYWCTKICFFVALVLLSIIVLFYLNASIYSYLTGFGRILAASFTVTCFDIENNFPGSKFCGLLKLQSILEIDVRAASFNFLAINASFVQLIGGVLACPLHRFWYANDNTCIQPRSKKTSCAAVMSKNCKFYKLLQ